MKHLREAANHPVTILPCTSCISHHFAASRLFCLPGMVSAASRAMISDGPGRYPVILYIRAVWDWNMWILFQSNMRKPWMQFRHRILSAYVMPPRHLPGPGSRQNFSVPDTGQPKQIVAAPCWILNRFPESEHPGEIRNALGLSFMTLGKPPGL